MKKYRSEFLIVFFCLFFCACSTTYSMYSRNIFKGKELLRDKEYTEAGKHFQDALSQIRDSVSLTFMAVTEYKKGNLESAEKWIREAEKEKPDEVYVVRTLGYRALIYLKRDRVAGVEALKHYIEHYEHAYPLESIRDLRRMMRTGSIDETMLETIIDEQIKWYEKEMEEYLRNNSGFIADHQRMFFRE